VRGGPKLSPEIVAALAANPDAPLVAREIGDVSYWRIWKIAKTAGIDLTAGKSRRGRLGLSPEKRAEIIAALAANPNATQVARQVGGVGHVTVWNIAKAAGIELTAGKAANRRAKLSPEIRAEIIAALTTNPNARQVARQVGGVSRVTVWKIAQREGIELTAGKAARGRREANQYLAGGARDQIVPAVA
jgi:hypothetical protein